MPCDDWLHCHCYKRSTILGLALVPLFAGPARAAEEGEAAKPPAPDDRFVFRAAPKKGQVVRAEDLALGGPQVQAYPMAPGWHGAQRLASQIGRHPGGVRPCRTE